MQPIFDSHAHYDDERFDPDREELIASLPGSGVELVLNAACDLPSCESSLALTRRWPFFYCSVGVHPHAAQEVAGQRLPALPGTRRPGKRKAVAIGEIGLDYTTTSPPGRYRRPSLTSRWPWPRRWTCR